MPSCSTVSRPRNNWIVAGAVVAVSAAALLVALTAVWHVQNLVVARGVAGLPVSRAALLGAVTGPDRLWLLLLLLCVGGLLWLEWPGRRVGMFLRTASGPQMFVVLSVLLLWLGVGYLFPGLLLSGDAGSHIARFFEVRRGLEAGTLSDWTNYDYLGSPLLGFTGPLVFIIGGVLDLVVHDANASGKIYLLACHMAAGWLFYWFVRRLGVSRAAALVSAIGFSCSFAHLHLFLWRGALPQGLTIVTLVLLFGAAEGLMQRRASWRMDWLLFALATAGLLLNHQPHAVFAAIYLALFGAIALLQGRWAWRGLPWMVAAGVVGTLMSIYAVLPVLAESDWVMIEPDGALASLRLPTPERLLRLVVWQNQRTVWGPDRRAAAPDRGGNAALSGAVLLPVEHDRTGYHVPAAVFVRVRRPGDGVAEAVRAAPVGGGAAGGDAGPVQHQRAAGHANGQAVHAGRRGLFGTGRARRAGARGGGPPGRWVRGRSRAEQSGVQLRCGDPARRRAPQFRRHAGDQLCAGCGQAGGARPAARRQAVAGRACDARRAERIAHRLLPGGVDGLPGRFCGRRGGGASGTGGAYRGCHGGAVRAGAGGVGGAAGQRQADAGSG
jgi:hypothetical protein